MMDSQQAETPLTDHVTRAVERMEAGARMILDSIPGDSSLSSSSSPAVVTKELARLIRQGLAIIDKPVVEALQFYANQNRYQGPNQRPLENDPYQPSDLPFMLDVTRDNGNIARAALSAIPTANGGE